MVGWLGSVGGLGTIRQVRELCRGRYCKQKIVFGKKIKNKTWPDINVGDNR